MKYPLTSYKYFLIPIHIVTNFGHDGVEKSYFTYSSLFVWLGTTSKAAFPTLPRSSPQGNPPFHPAASRNVTGNVNQSVPI